MVFCFCFILLFFCFLCGIFLLFLLFLSFVLFFSSFVFVWYFVFLLFIWFIFYSILYFIFFFYLFSSGFLLSLISDRMVTNFRWGHPMFHSVFPLTNSRWYKRSKYLSVRLSQITQVCHRRAPFNSSTWVDIFGIVWTVFRFPCKVTV